MDTVVSTILSPLLSKNPKFRKERREERETLSSFASPHLSPTFWSQVLSFIDLGVSILYVAYKF
jgi:hypothetical protein